MVNRSTRGGRRGVGGRTSTHVVLLCVLGALCGDVITGSGQQQPADQSSQPPRFQSSVEVTSVDVNVVDDRGRPIPNLTPADFTVRIDGGPRRVVTAEWVPLVSDAPIVPAAPLPEGFSSNENAIGGRLIVIVVDQPNIRFGGAMSVLRTVTKFIDRLSPSDRVAAIGLGNGSPATPFTADRERLKQAIGRMTGQQQPRLSVSAANISLSEIVEYSRGNRGMLEMIAMRECTFAGRPMVGIQMEQCRAEIELEVQSMAVTASQESDQSIRGLRDILTGLKAIDAPKTMILISDGFIMDEGGLLVSELGSLAIAARTSVYTLKLDDDMFDMSQSKPSFSPFEDRRARSEGLEILAGSARGAFFLVTGDAASLFERIESEMSGYYLLGVESDARDRDGKPHPIRVEVGRRGAIVRSRRQVVNAASDRTIRSPREAVTAGLSSPLLMSALPLRVATFALQGPEQSKVQLLIHADVGGDYTGPRPATVAFLIADANGRIVDSQATDLRLGPIMNGVPSALQYVGGASLAPGDYTLKLAVAEGDRVGSIEHPIHAALVDGAGVKLSELMVGGPTQYGEHLMQPTIGYQVTFGSVHGYVEAYGPQAAALTAKYEIATSPEGPALLKADVANYPAGDARSLFTHVMGTGALPPGRYVLRAMVSSGQTPVKTLTRAFEISAPKVAMTSAEGVGTSAAPAAELYLPVEDQSYVRGFRRDHAIQAATLEPFRERLAPTVKTAFETGVAQLTAGDYVRAELSFKKAIQPDVESTPALAYLAVCFAASGHDVEAASAWQTALADGSDLPQIYHWLTESLMRTHDLNEARVILEEAVEKWPSDPRFTRPLAMLYGTFGKGREAVRTLARYLEDHLDDRDAVYRGVEWIYHLHAAGAVAHTRAEDVKLARTYANAYEKAQGPQLALVNQWLDFLEKR